jgi:hypothetical protein
MKHLLLVTLLGAVVIALPCCGGDDESDDSTDALGAVIDASEKTIATGPAQVQGSVLGSAGEYEISGRFDPGGGYRLCAEIERAPGGYLRGRTVWLEERKGTYGTLTAPLPTRASSPPTNPTCPRGGWFDDHPPTLPLYLPKGIDVPAGGQSGAEDFVHATLLAVTQMKSAAIKASTADGCGEGACYEVHIDFGHFDRKPPERDEDLWTLRPLLRSFGEYPVEVRVNSQGLVDRVQLAAPSPLEKDPTPSAVAVDIRLSDFGDAPAVPRAQATAIE